MSTPLVIVRKKKPLVVTKKEEKAPRPTPPAKKTALSPKPEKGSQPEKSKAVKAAPDLERDVDKSRAESPIPEKLRQHLDYLREIESLPSPLQGIARACYFLCFLFNENRTTITLFPVKDEVLKKIYESRHDSLMVSYLRRGDRLTYRLTPEAKEQWESETGGKKDLIHLYRTPSCYVQSERGYYDLYQFHVVVEPFRFLFHVPVELASWVDEERLLRPRIHTSYVSECGLLRGKEIKMSRKATGVSEDEIGAGLKKFLEAGTVVGDSRV